MATHADHRVERILEATLKEGPADILALLAALRERVPDLIRRHEGGVHALLHRLVRTGRVIAGARGANGLLQYRAKDSAEPAATDQSLLEPALLPPEVSRAALKMVRGIKAPADRGRVQADAVAHLLELHERDATKDLGAPRALAALLQRIDRGKRTVVLAPTAGDYLRRVFVHDGPWLIGVVIAFFVVRALFVEVFRIPSDSMVPTLIRGDRVAVRKSKTLPDRWSILTFELEDVTYVKRLVGLPGETIALLYGDVFIDGERLVRPEPIRKAFRRPLMRWDFRLDGGRAGPGSSWRSAPGDDGSRLWIWDAPPLRPDGTSGIEPSPYTFHARDGYLNVDVRSVEDGGELTLTLGRKPFGGEEEAPGVVWTLRATPSSVQLVEQAHGASGAVGEPAVLYSHVEPQHAGAPGRLVGPVELSIVDGVLRACVGSWQLTSPREAPDGALTWGLRTKGVALGEVRLDVDQHYSHQGQIAVPSRLGRRATTDVAAIGHRIGDTSFFVLGDNSVNSDDSRMRSKGDIPLSTLVGPMVFRVWPPARIGRVR